MAGQVYTLYLLYVRRDYLSSDLEMWGYWGGSHTPACRRLRGWCLGSFGHCREQHPILKALRGTHHAMVPLCSSWHMTGERKDSSGLHVYICALL